MQIIHYKKENWQFQLKDHKLMIIFGQDQTSATLHGNIVDVDSHTTVALKEEVPLDIALLGLDNAIEYVEANCFDGATRILIHEVIESKPLKKVIFTENGNEINITNRYSLLELQELFNEEKLFNWKPIYGKIDELDSWELTLVYNDDTMDVYKGYDEFPPNYIEITSFILEVAEEQS